MVKKRGGANKCTRGQSPDDDLQNFPFSGFNKFQSGATGFGAVRPARQFDAYFPLVLAVLVMNAATESCSVFKEASCAYTICPDS